MDSDRRKRSSAEEPATGEKNNGWKGAYSWSIGASPKVVRQYTTKQLVGGVVVGDV
jgi:hypothetical protein